jgi:hypothetical protein
LARPDEPATNASLSVLNSTQWQFGVGLSTSSSCSH